MRSSFQRNTTLTPLCISLYFKLELSYRSGQKWSDESSKKPVKLSDDEFPVVYQEFGFAPRRASKQCKPQFSFWPDSRLGRLTL